jgi:siroheme synthase-like protein
MSAYPIFLRLEGRLVVVVGGGPVAWEKAQALREAGAVLRVVAPEIGPELARVADELRVRPFAASDLDGAWLVVSAAPPEVNRAVRAAADSRSLFVVAVDDVASCSAIGAARFQRGDLTVAISSDGRAPALVALLRRAIEALLPDDVDAWQAIATRARDDWKRAAVPVRERRPRLLAALNALYSNGKLVP